MYIRNLFRHWSYRLFAPGLLLREKYEAFRELIEHDKRCHELIAELQQIYYDQIKCDYCAVLEKVERLSEMVAKVVACLSRLGPAKYIHLQDYYNKVNFYLRLAISPGEVECSPPFVLALDAIGPDDRSLVGGKAHTLAEIRNQLKLPTLDGFVVTTRAFNYFLEANNLRGAINRCLAALDVHSIPSLSSTAQELQRLFENAVVPDEIANAIEKAVSDLQESLGGGLQFAVRSSALGEDSQGSYAGQYKTLLNVAPADIVAAYKSVIAGKYCGRVLTYRVHRGELDQETPMAVLVLPMVDARVSGVIYTQAPHQADAHLTIHCAWGLGKALVNGSISPGAVVVAKDPPHEIIRLDMGRQETKTVLDAGGGIGTISANGKSCAVAIDGRLVAEFIGWAARLEDFYQTPQDIEWCLDRQDKALILQSRRLYREAEARQQMDCGELAGSAPVLIAGGERASGGVAAGVVHNLEQHPSLENVPEGSVLVTAVPHPDLVVVFGKIKALVADLGSSAGHLASVAREFSIPALVNTGNATRVLETGMLVTVNADNRSVHLGTTAEFQECVRDWSQPPPDTPFNRKLANALQFIAPLNLVDPDAENFAPEGCKSFHDILRFSHEKAVYEMFSLGQAGSRRAGGAKKLSTDIPIVVYVLDLGGGIVEDQTDQPGITIGAVRCIPMRALWRGLSHPDIRWDANVMHFDWGEFDRLSRGIIKPDSRQFGSYAIFSSDYLNFHIHFGYHFVVLDTLCTPEPESNYLLLRFAGGGGVTQSRMLRVQFLSEVLSQVGFKIEQKGDLLDVQLSRCERSRLEDALELIGRLLGCTRLLDLVLKDRSQVDEMVKRFISGDYDLSPAARKQTGVD